MDKLIDKIARQSTSAGFKNYFLSKTGGDLAKAKQLDEELCEDIRNDTGPYGRAVINK